MGKELQKLLARSIEFFKGLDGVKAIALVGSLARETDVDEWSDGDFLVVVEDAVLEDLMRAEWISKLGEDIIFFRQFGREVRVLFSDFTDIDYIFYRVSEVNPHTKMDESLSVMIGDGCEILHDPTGVLVTLIDSVEPPLYTQKSFEELSDDIWFHIMWAAKKIARGELWYAAYWSNRQLQDLFLRIARWSVSNPVRMLRYVDRDVPTELLQPITDTFVQYGKDHLSKGLIKCMETYWVLQSKVYPGLNRSKALAYERIQSEVTAILTREPR